MENAVVAYVIIDLEVHDEVGFAGYRSAVPVLIKKHGGEYLVRGGQFEVIDGDWQPHRLVVLRFPDRAAVHAFFGDPGYAELEELRRRTSKTAIIAVDGID
jgi:uncharacterized protein (DUF1330 family)